MPVNSFDSDAQLPEDLCELGEELTAQARFLEQTYPCQPSQQTVERALQTSEPTRRNAWQRVLVGLTLVSLISVGVLVGKELIWWGERAQRDQSPRPATAGAAPVLAEINSTPAPPELPATPGQLGSPEPLVVAEVPTKPRNASRFSVRELVASADMLEEQTEADAQLSDAQKIALLEKALDRYRSVIIYLQDEIKTRDEERAEQVHQLRQLEQRLQLLQSNPTP
jgi:hypothetical protein